MDELLRLRREIDRTDAELLELFIYRMELCASVGRYKKERGIAVFDQARESEIISRRAEKAGKWSDEAAALWETLMSLSRKAQKGIIEED